MIQNRQVPSAAGTRRPLSIALISAALLGIAACGGGGGTPQSQQSSCKPPGDELVAQAVHDYIRSPRLDPSPLRFLASTGTDSSLPMAARSQLENRNVTYLFPSDSALQTKVREMLRDKGDYPTLLVTYHGTDTLPNGESQVRLGGHYVSGAADGKVAPIIAYRFRCDSTGWTLAPQDTGKAAAP